MVTPTQKRKSTTSADDLKKRLLRERPDFQEEWDRTASRRQIALALRGMRISVELTQTELAERAGWKQAFVAKLESLDQSSIPDLETIKRYAEACGHEPAIFFVKREKHNRRTSLKITEGFALSAQKTYQNFVDRVLRACAAL